MSGLANALNSQYFTYVSPSINFKATGNTTIFTTKFGLTFVPLDITFVCDSATAANGDSVCNIGTNAANFDNWYSGLTPLIQQASTYNTNNGQVATNFPVFPASTAVVLRVTTADTGTSISGKAIITGFYYQ
jgi:hypothetical protein